MASQSKSSKRQLGQGRRHQSQVRRQAGQIGRQAGRQRREEPGPGRRRSGASTSRSAPCSASPIASASWSSRSPTATTAEKKIKAYRTELRRTLKRTERRGTTARRKATTEAKKTRNRVEREARKRQRKVETTLKRNRTEVEQRVRKAIEEQTSRAQDLVEQVSDQLPSIR